MKEERMFGVYIMGNERPTLYVGMTNTLPRRVWEHKQGKIKGFTQKYKLQKLLYYEYCDSASQAIIREKQLKNMLRKEKLALIRKGNPLFADLSAELFAQLGGLPGEIFYL